VHESVAPRALPKRPQKQGSTAGQIQWLRRRAARRAAILISPNPAGVGPSWAEDRRRCMAWGQGRAARRKRPAGSCGFLAYAPSGLLDGIDLPPPCVMLLREECSCFENCAVEGCPKSHRKPRINLDCRGCRALIAWARSSIALVHFIYLFIILFPVETSKGRSACILRLNFDSLYKEKPIRF